MSKKKSFQPSPLLPADPLGQRFLAYFNHTWHFIHAPLPNSGEKPQWKTETRYPLEPCILWQKYRDPNQLIGLRFGQTTRYLVIDIDTNSIYHPDNDSEAYRQVLHALEDIGLCRPVEIISSHSGGIHIYNFFSEPIPTFGLACAARNVLAAAGLTIKDGQLEIYPNAKKYTVGPSDYKAVRLPLQTDSYMICVKRDGQSNNLEKFLDAADWSAQGQDLETLRQALEQAKQQQKYLGQAKTSKNAQQWKQDLEYIISQGWTDYGQTNQILCKIACYGVVWQQHQDQALVNYIVETAKQAPGYQQYCRHQHEIEKRARECAASSQNYYTPYCSYPQRQRTYAQQFQCDDEGNVLLRSIGSKQNQANNIVEFRPNLNTIKQQQTIDRINQAVAHLEATGQLAQTITKRAEQIIITSKQLYGTGVSQSTLHKQQYLALWHPKHQTQRCVIDQPEAVTEQFHHPEIPDPWLEPESPETQQIQASPENYTPCPYMKVLYLPQARSIESEPAVNSLAAVNLKFNSQNFNQLESTINQQQSSQEIINQQQQICDLQQSNFSDLELQTINNHKISKSITNPSTFNFFDKLCLLINDLLVSASASSASIDTTDAGVELPTSLPPEDTRQVARLRIKAIQDARALMMNYCLRTGKHCYSLSPNCLEQVVRRQLLWESGSTTLQKEAQECFKEHPEMLLSAEEQVRLWVEQKDVFADAQLFNNCETLEWKLVEAVVTFAPQLGWELLEMCDRLCP
ncbi:hypothetical protein H6G54_18030 [Anabaena cylindrica FACHB-243]|uniref:Uncharacterized protein n=1 Tax=Anabaena cylindrica (strain ATCC 27899 / PCC 7122) TaxID=272123 RepID=K9ZQB1_ANACC|nr:MULTISPECIES: hypothetical protein [Anabaena]AFZ61413.1 hypothetical protein Anacy_6143 [Anabaena cylindrica PCC 7122]MBD2419566.1 hypothetical protein [Anabaena cylindrica FACHB-243]MBY5284156.1 hypothetical protein [Anabaena sp. CCAP 1446/1C]MBY5309334.1 hypothetical protein [Anabaena sp. CCAP 1446/1C]MCM2409755.1 hypothetical protein [Anabaena sp. CCAP 1446/1C]